MTTLTDEETEMRFSVALRKDGKTQTLVRLGVGPDDERLETALEFGAEPVRLEAWQSHIAEAYLDGQSKATRMTIWAKAHGIEATSENGGALLELYQRDPEVELVEEWCDYHRNQHS
jgi:hypothetical protein